MEDALGPPIKGYGEETTRRRRTHVSHAVYEKEGVKHMRMRFYIKGIRNKAIVELDMKQVGSPRQSFHPVSKLKYSISELVETLFIALTSIKLKIKD